MAAPVRFRATFRLSASMVSPNRSKPRAKGAVSDRKTWSSRSRVSASQPGMQRNGCRRSPVRPPTGERPLKSRPVRRNFQFHPAEPEPAGNRWSPLSAFPRNERNSRAVAPSPHPAGSAPATDRKPWPGYPPEKSRSRPPSGHQGLTSAAPADRWKTRNSRQGFRPGRSNYPSYFIPFPNKREGNAKRPGDRRRPQGR